MREYTLSVNVSEKVVEVELKEGLPGYQEWFEEVKEEVKGVREVKEEGTVPVVGNEDEKERILKDIQPQIQAYRFNPLPGLPYDFQFIPGRIGLINQFYQFHPLRFHIIANRIFELLTEIPDKLKNLQQ